MAIERTLFTADRDTVDSLRVLSSSTDPLFEQSVIEAVPEINYWMVDNFAQYIPESTISRLSTIHERVIITDNETFNELSTAWNNSTGEGKDGFFSFVGDMIVVKDPKSYEYIWDTMNDESKQSWIQGFGSVEKAKIKIANHRFASILIHEVVHGYHPKDIDISEAFVEHGTCYYSKKITDEQQIHNFSVFELWEANMYARFLKKIPEIPHKIFFGSVKDEEQVKIISKLYKNHVDDMISLSKVMGDEAYESLAD